MNEPNDPLKIAAQYFELSNKSDFEAIGKLFADTPTYSSESTGVYLGRDGILAMQKQFHGRFSRLYWSINSVQELKPGVVVIDYDFTGTTRNHKTVTTSGLEYVIVSQNKIQHIEIRAKH